MHMQVVSQSDEEAEKIEIMQVHVPLWKWCNVIKQSPLLTSYAVAAAVIVITVCD